MLRCLSTSEDHTLRVGEQLAGLLRPGDIILLTGPLGAGKSVIARGIARGLGVSGHIPSPTFALMNVYPTGRFPLHHFDLYRIEDPEEMLEAGLDEFIGGEAVCLIEWHERASAMIPECCLEIRISPVDDALRSITLLPRGGFRSLDGTVIEGVAEQDDDSRT